MTPIYTLIILFGPYGHNAIELRFATPEPCRQGLAWVMQHERQGYDAVCLRDDGPVPPRANGR